MKISKHLKEKYLNDSTFHNMVDQIVFGLLKLTVSVKYMKEVLRVVNYRVDQVYKITSIEETKCKHKFVLLDEYDGGMCVPNDQRLRERCTICNMVQSTVYYDGRRIPHTTKFKGYL